MRNTQRLNFLAVLNCVVIMMAGMACSDRKDDAPSPIDAKIAQLEAYVSKVEHIAQRAKDRGDVENLFSNYMYLHNAFQDEQIKPLWAMRGTPGMSAQYSNKGVYTDYDSIMAYHSGRPSPTGKLILHYTTTPSIQIAEDGQTAKGIWVVAGTESGLSAPEAAAKAPAYMFEKEEVNGNKVWAHWVQLKYGVDFIKQDGEWKIWHFRCYEVSRAPFGKNWIQFAAETEASEENTRYNMDIAYFGNNGEPVFMPEVNGPPKSLSYPYRTGEAVALDPKPPVPYRTFSETFEY